MSVVKTIVRNRQRVWAVVIAALIVLFAWPSSAQLPTERRIAPVEAAAQVYQQIPEIPLENGYISEETGNVAEENTLLSRFVVYHAYIRQRPANQRLQWKLTMAEYLDAYERMSPGRYVDYGLRENPYEGDRSAIASLSRDTRNRLVNALYETYTQTNLPDENEPAAENR